VDLYSTFIVVPHTQGAQVRITQCYLQITPYMPLPRKHSPDGASPDWGCRHLIATYYSFIYPERMKGWVGLVGWATADGLPTEVVTRQSQVERRTAKVRLSETVVLPLCHATNYSPGRHIAFCNEFIAIAYWFTSTIIHTNDVIEMFLLLPRTAETPVPSMITGHLSKSVSLY